MDMLTIVGWLRFSSNVRDRLMFGMNAMIVGQITDTVATLEATFFR